MTSSNLPAELTQVLLYANEWQPPHSDRNVSKTVGVPSPIDFAFTLPHDINSYAFSKYTDVNVKDNQLGASKIPLRMPILAKQIAADNKESLDINKVIMHYLYEVGLSAEKRYIFGAYVVHKGISSNDAIRDEIYVQLCSQSMATQTANRVTGGGPFDGRNDPVWNLMVACLCAFPPTVVLAKYLLKYVSDNAPAGYDIVCQHKLLHCLQQQQPPKSHPQLMHPPQVRSARPGRLSRSYAPCLLELKAAAARACMALTGIVPTGERVVGQVESWMTGEQFASHLLRQRNLVDPSNSGGWTVSLRDEFDVYECAGNDFIMDLIGEIEVPPYFPSGTAYFLTMTDALRSSMSSSARQKWPGQPHNAERLRLMILDIDELPDLYSPDTSLPLTPESMSPPVISRQRTNSPLVAPLPVVARPAPPSIRPEDVYASRDELMSTQSALNKRREPTSADQLSKTSALNSRYAEVVNQSEQSPPQSAPSAASRPRPVSMVEPPASKPELSASSRLNGRYMDEPEPSPVAMRPKSMVVPPPPRISLMPRPVPMAPIRTTSVAPRPAPVPLQPTEPSMDQMIDNMFGDLQEDGNDPRALQRRIKGGGDDKKTATPLSPPAFGTGVVGYGSPYGVVSAAGMIQSPPIAVMPLSADPSIQLYQQQQQLLQQQMMQAAKQQQAAELQAALQAQQLHNQLLEQSVQGELLKRQLQDLQKENNETASGPSALANGSQKQAPPPTFAKPGNSRPLVPIVSSAKGSYRAPTQPTVVNGSPSAIVPPPPPQFSGSTPVVGNGSPMPPPLNIAAPAAVVVNGGSLDNGTLESPQLNGVKGKVAIQADAKSGDRNTVRGPPKKIGQIRWPPPSSLDEEEEPVVKPKMEIGRIKIEETKEEEVTVDRKLRPEEAQKRVNDMIIAARLAESAGEMPKKKPVPPTRPAKQIETGSIDMKARKEVLERQLQATLRKKDPVVAPPSDDEPTRLSPPPPVVKFAVPPPPPPPSQMTQYAYSAPEVEPLSPVASSLYNSRPPVDYNEHAPAAVSTPMTSFDVHSLDYKRTVLHAQCTEPYFTYDNVNWVLEVRKEVFSPAEKCENASVLHLIFPQIVVDVLNDDCVRIGKLDRQKMTAVLEKHNISARNAKASSHSLAVKREIVLAARDLPFYFCRLFAVYGGRRNRRVQMVGVSHSGVRLLTRIKDQYKDYIEVLNHIRFDELTETSLPRQNTVGIHTASQRHIVYTPRASQLWHMIEAYRLEHNETLAGGARPKQQESVAANLLDNRNHEHDDNPFDDSSNWED